MDGLKLCPLCKKDVAEFSDCKAVEECASFEVCDGPDMFIVVCDVLQGGCGCSTGYYKTREQAAEAWNRRLEKTCIAGSARWEGDEEYPSGYYYELSCGHKVSVQTGPCNYCPTCGAKVVSDYDE